MFLVDVQLGESSFSILHVDVGDSKIHFLYLQLIAVRCKNLNWLLELPFQSDGSVAADEVDVL